MRLSPHEQDRLLIHTAADVARRRRERGLLLNHPESIATLASWVLESARDGRTVAELMADGRQVLTSADVMPGIAALVPEMQIEATFPDGTKLVTLHDPIQPAAGAATSTVVPGEIIGPASDPDNDNDFIELNDGRDVLTLRVENGGDRPVQVGSHYHFAEANPALQFDRTASRGYRLDVPAGTAMRFEPGIAADVALVPLAGERVVPGLRGDVAGALDR